MFLVTEISTGLIDGPHGSLKSALRSLQEWQLLRPDSEFTLEESEVIPLAAYDPGQRLACVYS